MSHDNDLLTSSGSASRCWPQVVSSSTTHVTVCRLSHHACIVELCLPVWFHLVVTPIQSWCQASWCLPLHREMRLQDFPRTLILELATAQWDSTTMELPSSLAADDAPLGPQQRKQGVLD